LGKTLENGTIRFNSAFLCFCINSLFGLFVTTADSRDGTRSHIKSFLKSFRIAQCTWPLTVLSVFYRLLTAGNITGAGCKYS